MPVELKKITPVDLRSVGLDEKWLQDRIEDDPALLGLGELDIVGKEYKQPSGGRIDFLMLNAEDDTYYEVEVMLGTLNESHIVRTIEYWDIERQRRPLFDHRAVIVAERITARFFNVLRLLNRAVPMIAIQLSAFTLDGDKIVLHPVTVLDILEEVAEEPGPVEQADRTYWEKKSDPASLAVVDKVFSLLRTDNLEPVLTYNRYHIALSTTGHNFCWFHPRKSARHCHIEIRLGSEARDAILASLAEAGVDASPRKTTNLTFNITGKSLEEHSQILRDTLKQAEVASKS